MKRLLTLLIITISFCNSSFSQLKKTNYLSKKTVIENADGTDRTVKKENVYISINDPEGKIVINYVDRENSPKLNLEVGDKKILKEGRMHYYTLFKNQYEIAHVCVFFIDGSITIMLAPANSTDMTTTFGPVSKQ